MNLSMFSCSHVLSNRKQSIMSKRVQESASKKGFGSGKQKQTDVFGVEEPPERKANLSVRFGSFEKPEESRV